MLLTTIEPPPPGFEPVAVLTKQHLLSGPVAVLVDDADSLAGVLPDYAQRMMGVVLTVSGEFRLERGTGLVWHAGLPASWLATAAPLLQGWLEAIGSADDARQAQLAAELRVERVGRELDVTRSDYNKLTTRLQAQVRDLLATKEELSSLNEHLEERVAQRTDELARANERLSAALEELKLAQDEVMRTTELAGLGALVAGVAHELNTPIGNALTVATSLSGGAQILKTQHGNGQLKRSMLEQHVDTTMEMTGILERNLLRAADIIDKFKQITSDQIREQRRRFLLNEVVDDALTQMQSFLQDRPYHIHAEIEPAIEMHSYPGAILRILSHLVSNAITHGFEGRNQGSMQLRAARLASGDIELVFSDDGNGIAAEDIPRIFNPFFTTKLGHGSSGLGLYIVYNDTQKLLGGKLTVTSTAGQGTSFRLQVPVDSPDLGA